MNNAARYHTILYITRDGVTTAIFFPNIFIATTLGDPFPFFSYFDIRRTIDSSVSLSGRLLTYLSVYLFICTDWNGLRSLLRSRINIR